MRDKRWSLSVPLDAFALAEHAEIAREAERLGYTDAWSFEVDGIDGFSPLAVVGMATGMRVGIAIANVFTRGPATLAISAAGIAEIAPGRFCLGVGAGSQPIVEAWNGGRFDRPARRVREMVQFLRSALAGERVVFRGETFTVDGFRLSRPLDASRSHPRGRLAPRPAPPRRRGRRRRRAQLALRRRRAEIGGGGARGRGQGRPRSDGPRDHRARCW